MLYLIMFTAVAVSLYAMVLPSLFGVNDVPEPAVTWKRAVPATRGAENAALPDYYAQMLRWECDDESEYDDDSFVNSFVVSVRRCDDDRWGNESKFVAKRKEVK